MSTTPDLLSFLKYVVPKIFRHIKEQDFNYINEKNPYSNHGAGVSICNNLFHVYDVPDGFLPVTYNTDYQSTLSPHAAEAIEHDICADIFEAAKFVIHYLAQSQFEDWASHYHESMTEIPRPEYWEEHQINDQTRNRLDDLRSLQQ